MLSSRTMLKANAIAFGALKHTKSKETSPVNLYQATLHTVGLSSSHRFKHQSVIVPYFMKTSCFLLFSFVVPVVSVSLPSFDSNAFKCSLPPDNLALVLLELHYISPK